MNKSEALFQDALNRMPGGVNSPVRAFRSVGGHPLFMARGDGSRLWDVDGQAYVDYVGSWGPLIFGHRPPEVLEALQEALRIGTSFGAPTPGEVRLASTISAFFPSVEKVRLVNSGTEATMSAIRLARGFTGRNRIVKFDGCYHGHGDSLLVKAGSGVATLGLPDSPGVPAALAELTTVLPFNHVDAVEKEFASRGQDIACVIVEPVAGNMGCVPPAPHFLDTLRRVTANSGALLIFDEVMTGFRLARGGAQELYGIQPDLTTLGKIIGGGLPVGAYGGRADVMNMIAPSGPVYQAGTLSGNPLAVAAGQATLDRLTRENPYAALERRCARLEAGLREALRASGRHGVLNRVGSMFTLFFTSTAVSDFDTAKTADTSMFNRYFHAMLGEGIYLPPSQFEAAFVSAVHSDEDIERTIAAAERSLAKI